MADEFYDFEKALNELSMEEEELKRLVSAGEIRAFRSKGQMKFRKEDIESLRETGGGIQETEETLTDELVFDEGDSLSLDEEEGMATAKIDEQDTLIDEELPELESDVSDLDMLDEDAPVAAVGGGSKRGPTRRTTRVTRMREAAEARKAASPLFVAVLLLTTIAMLYGVVFLSEISGNTASGMTKGVGEFMVENFASGSD